MKKLLFLTAFVSSAAFAHAETYTWTGDVHGEWTHTGNWVTSKGAHPTEAYYPGYGGNEVVIFDPGEGVTVTVTNSLSGWPYNTALRKIEVRSGTVKLWSGNFLMEQTTSSVTSEVYVAENATLVLNGYCGHVQNGTDRVVIKTGKGTWNQRKRMGASGASGACPFTLVDVQEGVFLRDPDSTWDSSQGYNWNHMSDESRCRVHVRAGAEFQWTSYSAVDNIILDLDKGAVARAARSGSTTLEGITGEGDVRTMAGTSGSGVIALALRNDSYAFDGTCWVNTLTLGTANAAGNTFTIGASNTLAGITSGVGLSTDSLRFAPGIGEFWIGKWNCGNLPMNLADAAGEPITLHAGFGVTPAKGVLTGAGSFMTRFTSSTADDENGYTNHILQLTGELGSDAGARLVLGQHDAANDPDLSNIAAIRANGSVVFNTGAPVRYDNPVYSAEALIAKGETTLADVRKSGGRIDALADLTIEKGAGTVATVHLEGGETQLTLANCTLDGGKNATWMNMYDTFFTRPRTWGSQILSDDAAELVLRDHSDVTVGNESASPRLGNLTAVDSTLTLLRSTIGCDHRNPETIVWNLDNAALNFNYAPSPYNFSLPEADAATNLNWKLAIGARGGRITAEHEAAYGEYANHTLYLRMPLRPQTGVADGGITFAAPNTVILYRPVSLTGPVTVSGCRVMSASGNYAEGNDVLGTGDVRLDGGFLCFNGHKAGLAPQVAAGEGKALSYCDSSRIQLHDAANDKTPAQGMTLTTRALVRGERGVLFWSDDRLDSNLAERENAGTFKVTDGVACDAAGRVKQPFFAMNGHLNGGAWGELGFLSYSAENGFAPFANYTEGLKGGADSVARVSSRSGQCLLEEGTTAVAALKVSSFGGTDGNIVRVAKDATLRVGNGTDPACVLMDAGIGSVGSKIMGTGTLDFGTSEGVIAVARPAAVTAYPAMIGTTIAGSGGLTVAGCFGFSYSTLNLAGTNTYTGGTRISCAAVCPYNGQAFGAGPVEVAGSAAQGGQLCFRVPVTLANALRISGNGINYSGNSVGFVNPGALWFLAETTIAGPVEIVGKARVGSHSVGNGYHVDGTPSVGTFTGVISGGTLQIMQSVEPVVLTAANTYTGGTEIVSSTLTLRGPCSVGTGKVTLDRGVLRFENTEPLTFTNDIEGVGTIVAAGIAPVTFTGKGLESLPAVLTTLRPGWSFDYPTATNCMVVVGNDGLDLGGASLAVNTLSGSGRVENGLLTVSGEIRPGGADAIGTLTFAPGALVAAGATFVCEVGPDGMDKIVIENNFDLAALSLRTVRLGTFNGTETILTATALTGEFAATTFARKSHELAYGETEVKLIVGKGLTVIIR